jgi:hypothetical protein
VFFALLKKSSDGYVFFTDQRKRVGGNNLGQIGVSNLLQKASIMPRIFASNCTLVTCLFSCVIYANVNAVDLVGNSIVVAYGQNQRYHGTLWTHPALIPENETSDTKNPNPSTSSGMPRVERLSSRSSRVV